MAAPVVKDEAGPLWILLENFLESWPVKPKWVLLATLAIVLFAAMVRMVVASSKRRKQSTGDAPRDKL
jgi:hypothetical protein